MKMTFDDHGTTRIFYNGSWTIADANREKTVELELLVPTIVHGGLLQL